MKNRFPLACLLLACACAASGAGNAAPPPAERVADYASFGTPEGWTEKEKPAQGDPQVRLEKDLHVIKIRLAGGPASRYRSPADFMAGFETRSADGAPAEAAGTVEVSGTGRPLFSRRVAVTLPPPDQGGPVTTAEERFCAIPVGDRFLILTYSHGDSIPDPGFDGESAFRGLLKTLRLRR